MQEVKVPSGSFNLPTMVEGGKPNAILSLVLERGSELTIQSVDVYRVK